LSEKFVKCQFKDCCNFTSRQKIINYCRDYDKLCGICDIYICENHHGGIFQCNHDELCKNCVITCKNCNKTVCKLCNGVRCFCGFSCKDCYTICEICINKWPKN